MMDSVEYSGLRQYLLSSGTRESRVRKELWSCNGISYATYRKYLNHVREFGFPEEQDLSSPSMAVYLRRSSADKLPAYPGGGHRSRPSKLPAVYSFSGVRHILDDCKSSITVVSYGHLSTELLAYGSADGKVWVATLGVDTKVKKLDGGHTKEVQDLDWSMDNSLLLTCGLEGCVCLWSVDKGVLFRKFTFKNPPHGCRFHALNQNLIFVASGGDMMVYNGSTGSEAMRHNIIPASLGDHITAVASSNTFLFVGDSGGTLHMLKWELRSGVLKPLSLCYHVSHPLGKESAVSGIQHQGYTSITKGAGLLVTYADSTVGIYKVHDGSSMWPELMIKCTMPPAARRINAVWCPPANPTESEHIAMGGEDTNVHVYDVTRVKSVPVVVNELQAHAVPVVAVCWSFDELGLASGDCEGTVIVWKRNDSETSSRRTTSM
ncbi:hypothetical protein BSKO_09879 [Bryopsis sp. KO-2023]|nr:hypothetical protein BSKO_09879 [Bryopsis sp. KO-2023]